MNSATAFCRRGHMQQLVAHLQGADKRFLRNVDLAEMAHALFALISSLLEVVSCMTLRYFDEIQHGERT